MSEGRAHLDALLAELEREFPRFRIIDKRDSPLSRTIDVVLKILTLGGMRTDMTHYHTVIGDRLYVPPGWDDDPLSAAITLRHERVHLRQRRRYTLPGMTLLYLLFPLPLFLSYGRARIEWEAYEETLRATLELCGREALESAALKRRIVSRFTAPDYGWMWPFPRQVSRWYDEAVERLLAQADRAPASNGQGS